MSRGLSVEHRGGFKNLLKFRYYPEYTQNGRKVDGISLEVDFYTAGKMISDGQKPDYEAMASTIIFGNKICELIGFQPEIFYANFGYSVSDRAMESRGWEPDTRSFKGVFRTLRNKAASRKKLSVSTKSLPYRMVRKSRCDILCSAKFTPFAKGLEKEYEVNDSELKEFVLTKLKELDTVKKTPKKDLIYDTLSPPPGIDVAYRISSIIGGGGGYSRSPEEGRRTEEKFKEAYEHATLRTSELADDLTRLVEQKDLGGAVKLVKGLYAELDPMLRNYAKPGFYKEYMEKSSRKLDQLFRPMVIKRLEKN